MVDVHLSPRSAEIGVPACNLRRIDHVDYERKSVSSGQCAEEELCRDCLDIDFGRAFRYAPIRWKPYGVPVAELGRKTIEWGKTACPMCRLFATVRVPEDGTSATSTSEYHLRACSFLRVTCLVSIDRPLHGFMKKADTPCLLVLGGKGRSRFQKDEPQSLKAMISRAQSSGIICPVVSSATESPPRLGTRRLLPDRIDYDLLQGWYQFCAHHHRETCATNSNDYPKKLKVVDCRTQKIVAAPPSCSYVALSYVWGQQQSTTVSRPNSPCRNTDPSILPSNIIPSVIKDAMTVVLKLGWQYLWVDRYCIDQDDEAKHAQISQMDKVY